MRDLFLLVTKLLTSVDGGIVFFFGCAMKKRLFISPGHCESLVVMGDCSVSGKDGGRP